MSDELQQKVRNLPTQPGVYLFMDGEGTVLYVGKAKSLRARVRTYFVQGGDGRFSMHRLVPRIRDVEIVVTGNVKEALLLENQLIKKHRPRYNVRLRDDKNYLSLRIDPKEPFPRFTQTRGFAQDGAAHFGPYTSSLSLRETLSTLQGIFPLRTCSDAVMRSYGRRGRPCIEHAMGRCSAPCCDRVDEATYASLVQGAMLFLKGKSSNLLSEMRGAMQEASAEERYEDASRLRDRIRAIERTMEQQSMISTGFEDRDVIALAREAGEVEFQVMHVRQGKLIGGDGHAFRNVQMADSDLMSSFLAQFYDAERELPPEVLVSVEVENADAFEELWRERVGKRVTLATPQRGERRRLADLALRNARLTLMERSRSERSVMEALEELQAKLRLPELPAHIECYDVSHLSGQQHVASRVVFVDGVPNKQKYRRYKLRAVTPGDDYGALREVLTRRLSKLDRDEAPDLILIDGGKGQLNTVRVVAKDLGVEEIPLASIAKNRDPESASGRVQRHGGAKPERIFLPNVKDPIMLVADSAALLLVQRLRDESHRFAIEYHRKLRQKSGLRSSLEDVPGIGPAKRKALLKHFGGLAGIRNAAESELLAVPKLNQQDAENLRLFFRSSDTPSEIPQGVKPVVQTSDSSTDGEDQS